MSRDVAMLRRPAFLIAPPRAEPQRRQGQALPPASPRQPYVMLRGSVQSACRCRSRRAAAYVATDITPAMPIFATAIAALLYACSADRCHAGLLPYRPRLKSRLYRRILPPRCLICCRATSALSHSTTKQYDAVGLRYASGATPNDVGRPNTARRRSRSMMAMSASGCQRYAA